MQWVVTIAMLVLVQQPAKAPQSEGTAESKSTQSATHAKGTGSGTTSSVEPVPVTTQAPAAKESQRGTATANDNAGTGSQQAADEDRATQRKLTWFTGTLAGVGVLQLFVMFLTWLVYRRQAHEMTRQRHEMRRQRFAMEEQGQIIFGQLRAMHEQLTEMSAQTAKLDESIRVARDAAKAAQDSANAANKSIEVTVNKERARLVIELTDIHSLGIELWEDGFPYHKSKNVVLTHHGPTSAFNVSAKGGMFISDGMIPVDDEAQDRIPVSMPGIIRPESDPIKVEIFGVIEVGKITAAANGDIYLHLKALIQYDDVFGNHHKTPFWYVWEVDRFQPDETVNHWVTTSEWVPWGAEENKAD